ncbi:sodium-dependent lysophosphatidylcholine symporter 1-like [Astyanax mexicanus]|uniref:MFSD2 lysolipid transporter A, lysophospholipid n=1 Tax=Astyanax mexicanus TaxID=7994 RepID=A0A8B9KDT1_ASTMX|nr:sodium-dependent lysophosphatidylcholine symporter 1-like [Astyanax mexicanus]
MTSVKALQEKFKSWKETFSCCPAAEQDEAAGKDKYRSAGGGIPLCMKLCYAVGGIPYQATNMAMAFSFQIFLLDVVQMEAFFVSLILFVSRAWDALTDPLVGYVVSRSRRCPVGKLLHWSLLSMPVGVLSYALLWFIPHTAANSSASVGWYLTASCLFETFMSCYHVPYTSLNMFLGGSERDRDSATAFRMSAEVLAMLLAAVIQGQVLRVYNAEREDSCLDLDENHELPRTTPASHIAPLHHTREAFMMSALVLGALFFLCCMVLFLGVKEQSGCSDRQEGNRRSYLQDLKKLFGHVSYQRLVLGFLFSSLAFQMSLGNFGLFCIHVAGLGAQFQYLMLTILIAACVSVPVWQMTLVRLGKKNTLFIGLPLLIPALIVFASVTENFPVYMVMCILAGASVATLFLLPWSMLPDVVDEFTVQNPCCVGLEPLFFSCSYFCNKLGGGLSAAISTMTLHLTGYKTGVCNPSEGVVTALRLLLAPIPIVLLLLGLVFFYFYLIKEKTPHRQIQQDLEEIRSRAEMVQGQEKDTKLQQSSQQHRPKTSSFHSNTNTESSVKKKSYSQQRHSPSSSVWKQCNITTSPHIRSSTRTESSLKRPTSKSNLPTSQTCTHQSSPRDYEMPSERAKVTWV